MIDIPEGKTGTDRKTGQRVVRQGGQWVPLETGKQPQTGDASLRGRLAIGLGPMVTAEQQMEDAEAKGNPFSLRTNPGNALAKALDSVELPQWAGGGTPLSGLAKAVGGQDYQDYQQAASTFEGQLMPIMSGAAVSPSEARRQIKAALPELGDSSETLKKKGGTRRQMGNGMAAIKGTALPYPNEPTYGVNSRQVKSGGGKIRAYNPKTGRIE